MRFAPKTRLSDGSVLNSNLKVNDGKNPSSGKFNNHGIYKAMIVKRVAKDDDNNKFKQGVEYEAVITGGPRDGEYLHNVIPLDGFGGSDNFSETVYSPKTKVVKGSNKGDKTPPENTDGSYVVVGFMGGHMNHPVILKGYPQPNNADYGAVEEDGTVMRARFQGMNYSIDNDGVFTLEREGTTIEIDSQNHIKITSDKDVKIDSASKIELGDGATQSFIKGEAFKAIYDAHTHQSGGSGPPNVALPGSTLSTLIKGK